MKVKMPDLIPPWDSLAESRIAAAGCAIRSAPMPGVVTTHANQLSEPYFNGVCRLPAYVWAVHSNVSGGRGEIQSFAVGDVTDPVRRELRVCLLLRGRSATCPPCHRRTNGSSIMRRRCHAAVGAEWMSIMRYPEHVSKPICRVRHTTKPRLSRPSVIHSFRPPSEARLDPSPWLAMQPPCVLG